MTVLDEGVEVPSTCCPLDENELQQLRQSVNPMESCDDHGINLYTLTRTFVYTQCDQNIVI